MFHSYDHISILRLLTGHYLSDFGNEDGILEVHAHELGGIDG